MNSRAVFDLLRQYESRNVTFFDPAGDWPIVWSRARGCHVWDADGQRYLDLTAAFGVAAAGHSNSRVVTAGRRQMGRLLHAMGDVHPHELKARLARELSRITFERWGSGSTAASDVRERAHAFRGRSPTLPHSESQPKSGHGKTIFANSGFEAVEIALKTARLATGKSGV